MAIFKPANSEGGSKYLGICEAGVLGFQDRSSEFEWSDIFIEMEIKQKDSDYTKKLQIAGAFEKDSNGDITGGSVLNRMYKIFDTLGCDAGVNVKGQFENDKGEVIPDIASYLEDRYTTGNAVEMETPFVVYVYKSVPKPNETQSYTRVLPRLYPNDADGKAKMASDVKFLKSKGMLKEYDESAPMGNTGSTLTSANL
tara:strand:- start:1032 stop:1625 length:594 start_codon:yes stop_codon:yes gene_type:complete